MTLNTTGTTRLEETPQSRALGGGGAIAQALANGRLHLQHGPIDLIVQAWGEPRAVDLAYARAEQRFADILTALVVELSSLRNASTELADVENSIAKRMVVATQPFREHFVTPMAAVAGSIADEILSRMCQPGSALNRAYVNNGGDIAVYNSSREPLTVGIFDSATSQRRRYNHVVVTANDGIGGIATSGWRGRSHSLGVADAVTVLAESAASADAAATLIANAVNIDAPSIERRPASSISPDSDLGERLVTVAVGNLTAKEIERALINGQRVAQQFIDSDDIVAAYFVLGNECRIVRRDKIEIDRGVAPTTPQAQIV